MIAVIDYSVGNVRSVCNAFRPRVCLSADKRGGCDVKLCCEPRIIETAAGLVCRAQSRWCTYESLTPMLANPLTDEPPQKLKSEK